MMSSIFDPTRRPQSIPRCFRRPLFRRASGLQFAWLIAVTTSNIAFGAEPGKLAGHWEGKIDIPNVALKFDIDFAMSDGTLSGDISIPVQNASNLALADIAVDGDKVSFAMVGVGGDPKFSGSFTEDGETITGTFTQGGGALDFTMTRGVNRAAKAVDALQGFDDFVNKALDDWRTPGVAIAIVVEDEIVLAKGFGFRDLNKKLPVTTKTLFSIGSSTKAFTTFVLATLIEDGQLEWDKPVMDFLPDFRLFDEYATQHITTRDLVTHRSGLPRHDLVWYNSSATREQLYRRLRYLPPNEELRAKWQYNNLMFMTAGYLIERLTGDTWEHAVRARIFDPLGMNGTSFDKLERGQATEGAVGYQEKDDKLERMSYRLITNVGPAGSIDSNVEDMARWLMLHLGDGKIDGKQVIGDTALEELHTPQVVMTGIPTKPEESPSSYAHGWMTNTSRGHFRVLHGGNIDGFSALVTLYPRDRVGVVALANKNGAAMPGLVTRQAVNQIFGIDDSNWYAEALAKRATAKASQEEADEKKDLVRKTGTHPAHELDAYVGVYEHLGYGTLTITQDNERLQMTYNNIDTPLEHWHYEVFNGLENPDDRVFEDQKIRFLSNMKGEVSAVVSQFELLSDEIVFARKPEAVMSDPEYLAKFLGEYELSGQQVTVGIKGGVLTLHVPGQPRYELEPDREDEFNLKGLAGFSVRFFKDDDATWIARFNQPNGVFDAKRKS